MTRTTRLVVTLALTRLLSSCSTLDHDANATENFFPVLEVSGSYYDIGHQVGVTFKERIQKATEQYTNIFEFVDKDQDGHLEACKKITERHFPEIMEELRGMAAGAGIQFDRLFAMNMSAEVAVLISLSKQTENPGCSDIHLITEDNKYLLHNEDAAAVTEEYMYVVRVTTPRGVTFAGLCYPGIALCNGPGINSAGIMQANNSIYGRRYKKGVPRTILNRGMMETTSLDEALKVVTHPARANSYHHSIASVDERQLLSVEVTPDNYTVHKTRRYYVHTNHMLLPLTCQLPCDEDLKKKSSIPRFETISEALGQPAAGRLTVALCLEALSSHKGSPYSPCRHPSGNTMGKTVATAVFDIKAGRMTLYRGNPCTSVKAESSNTFVYNRLKQ